MIGLQRRIFHPDVPISLSLRLLRRPTAVSCDVQAYILLAVDPLSAIIFDNKIDDVEIPLDPPLDTDPGPLDSRLSTLSRLSMYDPVCAPSKAKRFLVPHPRADEEELVSVTMIKVSGWCLVDHATDSGTTFH